jgi:hypothetical protein
MTQKRATMANGTYFLANTPFFQYTIVCSLQKRIHSAVAQLVERSAVSTENGFVFKIARQPVAEMQRSKRGELLETQTHRGVGNQQPIQTTAFGRFRDYPVCIFSQERKKGVVVSRGYYEAPRTLTRQYVVEGDDIVHTY